VPHRSYLIPYSRRHPDEGRDLFAISTYFPYIYHPQPDTMPEHRQLAAIMFTDIVGYSALMSKNEKLAMEVLEQNRQIHKDAISKHHGQYIKEIGDGTLSIFQSSFDAVNCALDIQKACCGEKDFQVRVGIHIGDVILRDNDVFGDGVNIASRIESSGEPGGIYISERVFEDVKNKSEISVEFVGEKRLKNIDHSVKIYSISTEEIIPSSIKSNSPKQWPKKKSIIVLPFVNMSPEADQEYFSDGLTEEIITDLSHIHDLMVISRSSAMTFKDSRTNIREVAAKVNVKYVLEGSVRKAGNNLRITAQLIDASTDLHLWAEKYNGTLDDVFDIQEKVSRSIVDALKIKLSSEEQQKISKQPLNNAAAYEQYLLARHEIWRATGESLNYAIHFLEGSIHTFAKNEYLLTALAYAHFQNVNLGIDPDKKHLERASEYIQEALKLNPTLSKAFFIKSAIHETRGEVVDSFDAIKQALKYNPADSEVLMMIAFLYALVGKPDKGKPYARRAVEIDPLNPLAYSGEWWVNQSAGEFEEAHIVCRQMYEIDENYPLSLHSYGYTLALNNKIEKATKVLDSMFAKYPDQPLSLLDKALRHAINNEKNEALNSINGQLLDAAKLDHLIAYWLAEVYSLINEKEKALNWLERATKDIYIDYPFFSWHDPFLENIRGEERFKALMKRVKKEWEDLKV
jgi:TolB-like protein/class 3 adenylate cyclase/Flp pilus assembly protein TadD